MSIVLITGSCGLVGSESVKFFALKGFDVIGIDNNLRLKFFGKEGNTNWVKNNLIKVHKNYKHYNIDIRNYSALEKSDALVLMTEWNAYRNLNMKKVKDKLKNPIFVDLRNIFEPKEMKKLGFNYYSIG